MRYLEIEFLEAARNCGASLQKALAAPGLVSLCRGLAAEVAGGTWRPGLYTRFAVKEPKLREIFAPCFADRVAEAWLIGQVEPALERLYIDDSYANRKGKGPLAAVQKAQKHMRRPGRQYCLQLDVRGFFHSIHRPTLLDLWRTFLERARLEPERLELASFISRTLLTGPAARRFQTVAASRPLLKSVPAHKSLLGAGPETGLPIGSVASQHFANFYLSSLDHFIKHELRVKDYIRYMDDLLFLGPDIKTLAGWKEAVSEYLAGLRLELHQGKSHFSRTAQGVEYLGYRVYPHHLHVCGRTARTLKARLDFFKHLLSPNGYPKCQRPVRGTWASLDLTPPLAPEWPLLKKMEATINSYLGLMAHSDSWRLRKSLYEQHFGPLKRFFAPTGDSYGAVHVKKRFQL